MNRTRSEEAASVGVVFAVGFLCGALLTCIAVAIAIPQLLV